MRILVTGGAGFVGSNVIDRLLPEHDVVALDDLSTGDRRNLARGVELLEADIADAQATVRAIRGRSFDAIVHCASKTKVVESVEKPELYRRVIVEGTRNMIEVARACGVTRFVNFSSGGVLYGETPRCADETQPPRPISPYGTCKWEAEQLVDASGISALTLRPGNIYGPRQRTDLEGGVVAIFARCWREGAPLPVRGDGTMERDYVFVGDIAASVLAALSSDASGGYNIGTGVPTSVNALIDAMASVLGPPPKGIERVAEKPGELRRNCLDASRAARDGLWRAPLSLRDGLRVTLSL